MSKEIRIGIVAVLAILIFILGFKFLKGRNIFANDNTFYVVYDNVDNLKVSAAVLVNGLQVGTVTEMYLNPANSQTVVIALEVSKAIKVPKDAIAEVSVSGLMSDRMINLNFKENCTSNCAVSGDTLQGVTLGLLGSMLSPTDLDQYMDALGRGLGGILDTLNDQLSRGDTKEGLSKTIKELQLTITHLMETSESLARIGKNSEGNIEQILQNTESLTGTLNKKSAQIAGIIDNANTLTSQLKTADLGKTMSKVNNTIDTASAAIAGLKATLANGEKTLNELNNLLAGIKRGEGTLGQLVNDKALYTNLEKTSRNLNLLLQDFRLNPKRYVNVSVFGKKQKDYNLPENDPADTLK